MNITEILKKVDTERLYQHVLQLEGIKHPIDTPEKLREAAGTIYAEMESYGISVRAQEFQIEGWDDTFLNIEGWIGDEDAPAVVIINHYDTVYSTPGANDNAAGVAVMLEAARVLAEAEDVPTVRFVSATLEEGLPPTAKLRIRQSAQRLGLADEQHRYTSYQMVRTMQKRAELIGAARATGKSRPDAMAEAAQQLKGQIPDAMFEHIKEIADIYREVEAASSNGMVGKIGSSAWVEEAVTLAKKIQFAICLDEIGTTSKQPHSQMLPAPITYDMMQLYKVDTEQEIGDWTFIIADESAAGIAQAFCKHCERDEIDLAYAFTQLPGYEQIVAQFPQALGADHAPFWAAGIPAMFTFDTSTWRNPFYHSMADTIDRLDFDHITKICKATIATAIDPTLRG